MPPSLQSLTGTTSQGSILLIEEYDALAAAIGSALKKFAPQHVTHVAPSLAEAKARAKKVEPDLFVIDFDPAYPGLTEFLQKMRGSHPDASVLVIAAGLSGQIAAQGRSFGALQFIKKPFELADFGAAVQALLGPSKESQAAKSRRSLRALSLADVVLAQCAGARSVLIEVAGTGDKSGEIHVLEGHLSHAETSKHSGSDALREMLTWPDAQVREREKPSSSRRTIERDWAGVFLEALREAQPQQPTPVEEVAPVKPPPKTGKKIVAIDDTEMLLIFVEDVLSTVDPQIQITTALNGISGIKEVERIMPDLILLDYSLPDINGDEVCQRLLENEQTARIPILMMSGHVPEMSKTAAAFENVVATIAKPFLSDALIGLVQQTLSAGPRPVRRIAPTPKLTEPPPPPKPTAQEPARPAQAAKPAEPPPLPATPTPKGPSRRARAAKPVQPPPSPPVLAAEKPARQGNGEYAHLKPSVVAPPLAAPEQPEATKATTISTPVVSDGPNDVVLGLFLEVVSMQLTPEFRMGAIRAKPSSLTVSLHVASPALQATLPQTGFQLGRVGLDENGRIATIRLTPTLQPFKAAETRNAFQIGGLSVVPIDSKERIQLTSAGNGPMTMQLLANLEIAGVELSPVFQIEQLVLKNRSNTVRVTLSSQAVEQEEAGATCETVAVRLDHAAQIAELLLNPIT